MANPSIQSLLQTANECHDFLGAADIPHVVIGGLAVCLHGHTRNSRDVDLLVRRDDWDRIRQAFESAQYVWHNHRKAYYSPKKVRVDFRFGGDSAGTIEMNFPNPGADQVREIIDGLPVIALANLLETKLASALCGQGKGGRWARRSKKHFEDIVGLIKSNDLLP